MSFDPTILRASLQGLRDDPDALIEIIIAQAGIIEELRAENAELRAENAELRAENAELRARIVQLEERLAELEGGGRGAAPFARSESKRSKTPGKPGRKPGHTGSFRQAAAITETIEVPLDCCPQCGGTVDQLHAHRQIIEEIPPIEVRVVELISYSGRCRRCGKVRSKRHPLQMSTATGAAGVQLGPNATAIAIEALYSLGQTKRKVCSMLETFFNFHLSPGGLVEISHRVAERLAGQYEALIEYARRSSYLHADETSWYIGAPRCTLWAFTRKDMTLYHACRSRARHVLLSIIGPNFPGVLISDCLSVYDSASPVQHKCYAHHLRAISLARDRHPSGGSGYLTDLKQLLRAAMTLKTIAPEIPGTVYANARRGLDRTADALLGTPRSQPEEEYVRKRLLKQRDHLFVFLDYPEVDATNNLAERQLRPAIIARKLSCGNKTDRGAHTWEILASLSATCHQRGTSFIQLVRDTLCPPSTDIALR